MTKSETDRDAREDRSTSGREGINAPTAMRRAAEQLRELLGGAPDSVSAVRKTDTGWTAVVEVVEIERIPDTSSVMASYRVELDDEGELTGYEKERRYARGQIDR
ncbi:gas vesicle protein [Streptomyces sp. NPDC050560]|uniref:gas vesicle protein n=1 Tax=Streptomyces sp. NPDC050560 TaxID=3365630 RepID=UPI0037A43088